MSTDISSDIFYKALNYYNKDTIYNYKYCYSHSDTLKFNLKFVTFYNDSDKIINLVSLYILIIIIKLVLGKYKNSEGIVPQTKYDFFDNIPTYLINVEKANKDASELNTDDNCVSFSKQHTINNTDIGKQICEQFIKLCKQLPNIKNYNITDPNYRKDWDFLSYWLNSKLRESELNGTICPKKFYDGMENHCINTLLRFVTLTNLIYNINDEDISRMNVLYILHENYSQLDKIINDSTPPKPESLLELSSTCSDNYIKAKYMCYGNYNKFCEKLKDFKTKYEKLFKTAQRKGNQYTNNFKELTDYDNINIISTTVIGSAVGLIPLLGILYKVRYLNIKF
ncbi:hypothetical protein PVMG_05137 [Plasmodium vivax Mauritania I]|uniref:Uncharacterized protein n=1 Tax=Plasmodium vivax Mauritania I TaxID=1035515 RepID=A0A0J9TJ33_PLAVI|nr:hypothetical protein PVMG_05137 [Plasmodium vivax Mauritania I]